jgi:deazaflavin-dependent oxidoreductase (nitroreductase family)
MTRAQPVESARSASGRTRIRRLAPLTTHVLNPVMRLFSGRVPGFGILTHTGRTTGRVYPTPLLVHRSGDHYLVALWYGSDVQWVRNVVAAGGCEIRTRGLDAHLVDPELVGNPELLRQLPAPLRLGGRIVGLSEVLRLRAV